MALGTLGAMASQPDKTELTVYLEGFGLVKERRTIYLRVGEQTLVVEDIAEHIDPNSVGVRSLSNPGSFAIVEQTFRFDSMDPTELLRKAIGRKAVLSRILSEKARERTTGLILSAPKQVIPGGEDGPTWDGLVFKADDGRFILSPSGQLELAQIPKNFYYRPALVWEVSSKIAGENNVEISYITRGVSWKAGYVLYVDPTGTKAEFTGWVTITNQSGRDINNAHVRVMNEQGKRVGQPETKEPSNEVLARDLSVPEAREYHIQRPMSIRDAETKQVLYCEALQIALSRRLVSDPLANLRDAKPNEKPQGVGTFRPLMLFAFRNSADNELGRALPPGQVRIFQRDAAGATTVLDEDTLDHVSPDGSITLLAGHASHVSIQRERTGFEWIGPAESACRETFEITFHNRRDTDEEVHFIERNWLSGKVSNASHPYTQIDTTAMYFLVSVPAKGSVTMTYQLESKW